MKKITILLSFILVVIIASGSPKEEPKIITYKLDNGLTVILKEDHRQPKVFGGVITKVGAKDDPDDATGMAHYQEHMLFKGTEKLGTIDWEKEKPHIDKIFELYDELGKTKDDSLRKEIQDKINKESIEAGKYAILNETSFLVNAMGGTRLNAGTGPDQTVFYNQFPPNQMEKWLDLYAERFHNPVFRTFQSELEVVYEEKNMYDDQFFIPILEAYQKQFFKNHPYGQRTIIGTTEDLKNPSLTKMYRFFKDWYRPGNMALVIVGDFDAEQIKPTIAEKFSRWEKGEVPAHKKYEEKPFDGREFLKVRMSPIPIAAIGYRSPSATSDEALLWEITVKILSNNMQTGLLDQLVLNNEMPMAMALDLQLQDYGATLVGYFPGILKSLKKGEKKVLKQVELLKQGKFDEELVETVKADMYKTYQLKLESIEIQATELMSAFSNGKDPLGIYDKPAKIKAVTKEDIVKIANKYFTENCLVIYSKMGFPKKEKLDKPGYEPVVSNTNAKSPYREHFEQIPSTQYSIKPVDIQKEVIKKDIADNIHLRYTKNPVNDIAELNLQFNIGKDHEMMLGYSFMALNDASPEGVTLPEFKEQMSKTQCSYHFYSGGSFSGIKIKGPEVNLQEAYKLVSNLVENPTITKDKVAQLYKQIKMERKMEKTEPDEIASGLYNYLIFGEHSKYLNRLGIKEVKKLKPEDLLKPFKKAVQYEADAMYIGQKNIDEVSKEILDNCEFLKNVKEAGKGIADPNFTQFTKNEVYFINHKRAKQSKVFLFINQDKVKPEEVPLIEAFNMYFGGGFSGLVLQEIREYRSMAYSAAARFDLPQHKDHNAIFFGYVGTQCDKTLDALKIFNGLIRDMPEKPERMEMIRNYLINSAITKKPDFRSKPWNARKWENLGYDKDPVLDKVAAYKEITFDDLVKFYEKKIKEKSVVIALVGDTEKIDMEEMKNYGTLIEKQWEDVFKE